MNEVHRNRINLKKVMLKIALNHYESGELSREWMEENLKTPVEYAAALKLNTKTAA